MKEVIFEPLSEVYFSDVNAKGGRNNSKILVSILLIIVVLILVLSIINYMNLTIAQSGARAKDIAIRKLLGSSRVALIKQHIIEIHSSNSIFVCHCYISSICFGKYF